MHQKEFAKQLRRNMTDAEQLLWRHLRAHRFDSQKFKRQQPLGPYIVDFVHFAARVVIEADGGQHNENANDVERDEWLTQQGFRVLRFWNTDILQNTEAVLNEIWQAVATPSPQPLSRKGRGGLF